MLDLDLGACARQSKTWLAAMLGFAIAIQVPARYERAMADGYVAQITSLVWLGTRAICLMARNLNTTTRDK